eukprot:127374-Rhodomonas_salina.2
MSLVDDSYEPLHGADGFIRTPSEFSHPERRPGEKSSPHLSYPNSFPPVTPLVTATPRRFLDDAAKPEPRPRFLGDAIEKSESMSSDSHRRRVHKPNLRSESSFALRSGNPGSWSNRGPALSELQQSINAVSAKLDLRLDDLCRRIDSLPRQLRVQRSADALASECAKCGHRPGSPPSNAASPSQAPSQPDRRDKAADRA